MAPRFDSTDVDLEVGVTATARPATAAVGFVEHAARVGIAGLAGRGSKSLPAAMRCPSIAASRARNPVPWAVNAPVEVPYRHCGTRSAPAHARRRAGWRHSARGRRRGAARPSSTERARSRSRRAGRARGGSPAPRPSFMSMSRDLRNRLLDRGARDLVEHHALDRHVGFSSSSTCQEIASPSRSSSVARYSSLAFFERGLQLVDVLALLGRHDVDRTEMSSTSMPSRARVGALRTSRGSTSALPGRSRTWPSSL